MSREKQNKERNELLNIFAPSSLSFEEACILTDEIIETGYRKQSKGEWIFEHEFYGKMLCSNCKEEALVNENNEYVDSDFCPNCGAKMKGGK